MDLDTAITIAVRGHEGFLDKQDKPYILHPLRVMMQMDTIDEMIVAVLHDVIEDTDITIEYLTDAGFDNYIIESIIDLTRLKDEDYFSYIHRLAKNKLARKVKVADLKDNGFNRNRPCEQSLRDRYAKALEIIQGIEIDAIVEEG